MKPAWIPLTCACFLVAGTASAKDYFLTIGGGYSPSGNQASLEKNVLLFQSVLKQQAAGQVSSDVFFADGTNPGRDLEVMDRNSVPKANRLMAEFFGSSRNLGLSYRNHAVPDVRGSTSPQNIRRWFKSKGSRMRDGDRLFVYVTAHGSGSSDRGNEHNTTIATWNNTAIRVSEFVSMLDGLPKGIEVIAVMVQCHSGGFARFIFNGADPKRGLSQQKRAGFFATVHDRNAAGCTPEVDEATYVEYSTYFWAALTGRDRTGKAIARPDYDKNGTISFDEAHAYTVLTANTIDLPIKTSGEFLTVHGRYGKRGSDSLTDDTPWSTILKLASPVERAILTGLSEQLDLKGEDRVMTAHRLSSQNGNGTRGRRFRNRRSTPATSLRRKIAADLRKRWPELANVMNPRAIELVTKDSRAFVRAVEKHKSYDEYRKLADQERPDPQKKRVKYERLLRTVDNIIFAENLKRASDQTQYNQYRAILKAETGTLAAVPTTTSR